MNCEVIVSTYNNPSALDRVLLALQHQRASSFCICVADDGSGSPTQELVASWQQRLGAERLRHVWQPDDGFLKNRILNRAIASSKASYVVFIDGDCVARPDFIDCHLSRRKRGHFLSGGMVRLSRVASDALTAPRIADASAFSPAWLASNLGALSMSAKLKAGLVPGWFAQWLERTTPVKRTWNGANSSGWRDDLLAVNGFDERLRYGAEDVEMGARLNNHGVRGLHVRYSAVLLHIDHDRPYANVAVARRNKKYAEEVRRSGITTTAYGIVTSASMASPGSTLEEIPGP